MKNMLRYKTKTRPGLVALYDIRPGNGAGPFLQPRSPDRRWRWGRVTHFFCVLLCASKDCYNIWKSVYIQCGHIWTFFHRCARADVVSNYQPVQSFWCIPEIDTWMAACYQHRRFQQHLLLQQLLLVDPVSCCCHQQQSKGRNWLKACKQCWLQNFHFWGGHHCTRELD